MKSSSACRCRKGLGFLFGAALVAGLAATAHADDPLDFTASLTAPSPHLTVPLNKYSHTASGLLRSQSDSGNQNGTDRPVVKSISGAFLTQDFTYELTLQSSGNTDIIFVGIGEAVPCDVWNEPARTISFRVHQNIAGNRIDAAVLGNTTSNPWTYGKVIATYNPAGTTLRLERHGDSVTLSVPGQGADTVSLSANASFLNSSNTYLFFGNTATGTTFSNLSVHRPAAPADSDGDGVNDTGDTCPGTASGSPVNGSGCSGAQLVALACPAGGSYKNHGAYVSCVSKAAEDALAAGLLTSAQKDAIVSEAAQSDIGKK